MKFSLQTLLWSTTLIAVLLGCWIWVQRERVLNRLEMERVLAQAEEIKKFGMNEMARADLYRRSLGRFNASEKQQPFIRFVPLPNELGGMQLHGFPFTWRWRLFLPSAKELNNLVVCCAVEDVPREGFEVPPEKIMRTVLDNRDGQPVAGNLYISQGDQAIDDEKPVEVLLIIRLEYNNGAARLMVNFEIEQFRTFYRGKSFNINCDRKHDWLRGVRAYSYEVSGFGIEDRVELPLLKNGLNLDSPTLLLRLRGKRHIEDMKYEEFEGPADGLMIWLDRLNE
jgi:hypothetical protein